MFWRRRRTDGFEWQKHVRTTIKLRRENRRQNIEAAKAIAIEQADRLKRSSIAGARQSGHLLERVFRSLASAVRRSATGISAAAGRGSRAAASGARAAASSAIAGGRKLVQNALRVSLPRLDATISRMRLTPGTAGLLAIVAGIVTLSLTARIFVYGASVMVIGSVVMLAALTIAFAAFAVPKSALSAADGLRLRRIRLASMPPRAVAAVAGVLVLFAAAGGAIAVLSPKLTLPSVPQFSALEARPPEIIEGRASALSGDTLEIDDVVIRLAGVEAPELTQRCRNERGRFWRCGRSARNALRRLVRRRSVTCTVEQRLDENMRSAICAVGNTDIGARLVREGRVFASGGVLTTRYSDEAAEAKKDQRGIWRGEAERPEDFRRAVWKRASEEAPSGCPIKGTNGGESDRIYVVPWSPSYDRTRIRSERGDRWFCSEAEARSAGWGPERAD